MTDIVDLVLSDPGLTVNIRQADIDGGADAAVLMNSVILQAIEATGVNADRLITPDELRSVSDYIRADSALYASFVEGHGDDDGNDETGFHLVQGDGGAYQFQGRDFIDTVADAIYHIGFEYQEGRFRNEDGNANETVDDVAGWLNWYVNGQNIVFGTAEGETLRSGHYSFVFEEATHEIFQAGAGDDKIWAGIGDDWIYGGDGNDTSGGDYGNDRMYGEDGNDHLWGDEGNDRIWGGDGDDRLGGGTGHDLLKGGAGNDIIGGDEGRDKLIGGDGDDRLYGEEGDDTLKGEDGADTLGGGSGDDLLYGQAGDDKLHGDEGRDKAYGGSGNDSVSGGDGDDKLWGDKGDDSLYGGEGDDTMWGGSGSDRLDGGAGDDMLKAGKGDDSLKGEDGDDLLYGSSGNDTLTGGEGADIYVGGSGADMMYDWEDVDAADIFVFASGDSGTSEGTRDIIKGFNSGVDKIDLTAFEDISFIAADLFNANGGAEARFRNDILQVDENGDGVADLEVEIYWIDALTTADVLL
ncbi:calcium-binding protein [Algirhabdus cladophorae]|uniref:calcium-binding protein n=1 Tax=Algirhabdus cladophorae TaxID=3377108 RepID=UPI003B84B366